MSAAPRRYFDHAATSFPKPPEVVRAIQEFAQAGVSAGRGAYREALDAAGLIQQCRAAVRRLLGAGPDDAVVFTHNGTDALNLAIKGWLRPGDHAVTTVLDHNSVLRPLTTLQRRIGVQWTGVDVEPGSTRLDPQTFERALRPETRLAIVSHASNVTGVLQPIDALAEVCRQRGVPLLLDAAQSAGHVPIDMTALGLDMLATPGHKALQGPTGTGLLIARAELAADLQTQREGGTGSQSERPEQPDDWPDKFEAGSLNALGLAGLLAGVEWIERRGVEALRRHELTLMEAMIDGLSCCDRLRWFGPRVASERVGVFSVAAEGVDPHALAGLLELRCGVLTRAGFHCAPLAHRALGLEAAGGATRLSLGPMHTIEDVAAALAGLEECLRLAAF